MTVPKRSPLTTMAGALGALGALGVMLSVALVAGCDKKSAGEGGGSGDQPAQGGKAAAAEALGSALGLPAELSKLTFEMTEAEALKALGWESASYVDSKAYEGVTYTLRFDKGGKLQNVEVGFPEAVSPLATKAWGKPLTTKEGDEFWLSDTLRARRDKASDKELSLQPFTPIDKILGSEDAQLAIAKGKPMLGATVAQLKDWGALLCKYDEQAKAISGKLAQFADSHASLQMALRQTKLELCLPAFDLAEYTTYQPELVVGVDGKVNAFAMTITDGGSAEYRAKLVKLLEGKWGSKKVAGEKDDPEHWFLSADAGVQAQLRYDDTRTYLRVMGYTPVDKLLGGDKPGLSIENDKILGGTFDEIKAADPDHFVAEGTLAKLVYPPIAFSRSAGLEVDLQKWAGKDKTHAYKVVLHYDDHPPLGDEIMTLLKKKFGEPTKSEPSGDGTKFTFEKNGRKVSVWQVSNQFQITVSAAG